MEEDSLKQLLREAGAIPQLTAQDEIRLGTIIQTLRALSHRTPEQDGELQAALQEFVAANIRFVVYQAKKHGRGTDIHELIGEGCIALIEAATRFDPTRGFRFSTFATSFIFHAFGEADKRAPNIYLPAHIVKQRRILNQLTSAYLRDHEREPDAQELYALLQEYIKTAYEKRHGHLGTAEELLEFARARQLHLAVNDIQDVLYPPATVSADAPDEQGGTYADLLIAHDEPEQVVDHTELLMILAILTPRARKMLNYRLGIITDAQLRTLDDAAKEWGVTRERVRQVEERAIEKLGKKFGPSLRHRLGE
jgi:RNA polymerase primary sigma factor